MPSACIRYALVASSLSSLSGNLLTELLVQLVSAGAWPYVSGLAEVRLDPNPRSRSRGIAALAALGEDEDERFALLGEALEAALQLPPDYKRMEALQHLAPVLPPVLLARAAADARTILDPSWRARVLVVIGKCIGGGRRRRFSAPRWRLRRRPTASSSQPRAWQRSSVRRPASCEHGRSKLPCAPLVPSQSTRRIARAS